MPIYTLSLCRGHTWRLQPAKQETLTPPGHLLSPLVCMGSWMSTVVLYCWFHSDSASVLLYLASYICSTILLDIVTIFSQSITLEFEKHIPDIYPDELQLNKANISDKETSFFDLNIKVIGSDIHTSVYDKRDDFGFPIVNFPWLSGDVPRLPSCGIYISQLVRFARCCTSVLDFHSKNLKITTKLLTQGYRYRKLRKTFGKFFRSYSELLSKFGDISFQVYLSKGIYHPVTVI